MKPVILEKWNVWGTPHRLAYYPDRDRLVVEFWFEKQWARCPSYQYCVEKMR